MEITDILEQSPLFQGLDHEALEMMAKALVRERHPRNCDIMPPAPSVDRFYVVVTGRIKVTRSNEHDGRELTLWLLGPGDGFDVVSLMDSQPHVVSAWTVDEVETLSAPVSLFRDWLERYPAFRMAVYRYIAKQLRELMELAGSLALDDTMTRLVHLLLRHFDTAPGGSSAGVNLIHDLPHEELASLIGSVRVVVNRLIARLKKDAVVQVHNGRLGVLNLKRLLRHADAHLSRGQGKSQKSSAVKR
jgi:CRP/FNR family transcriptional regulator, cyclic AMP receptor protein